MDEKRLEFAIFCIESLAEKLEMNPAKIYGIVKNTNVLDEYIIPCYEPLHSQSKGYIVEDLIEVLKERAAYASK
ncbi:transcriptional regulator [Clostridium botulinum C/D str. BKT12695]|nr:transcriptional regulator [Clostridium botulinum C/D str. BKT12695]